MGGPLAGVRACVFDAYGTLFDVSSAAAACHDALPGSRGAALSTLWRDKQLQYTWLRALQGRHADFWQVTGDALDFSLETLGIADPRLRSRLMNLYLTLDAYPEVPEVLKRLKATGLKIAILSNGSPGMLRAAVDGARIAAMVDAVFSIEEVGVYKPHPKVYQLAVDSLALDAQAICFLSANAWDAYAAAARATAGSTGVRDRLAGGVAGACGRVAYSADRSRFAPRSAPCPMRHFDRRWRSRGL
jgi:2-haloacid dehalogenase